MTVCEIVKYVRFLVNKHQKGNVFTPEDINLSFNDTNLQVYNDERAKFQPGLPIPEPIRRFKTSVISTTLTGGVYSIPSAYGELISAAFSVEVGGVKKYGRFVDESTSKRLISTPSARLRENPIGVLKSGSIVIYPTDADRLTFEYLRLPDTPVYDYYIDEFLNEICLAPGATHTLAGTEVGSAGQVQPTVVTSLTVELDWDKEIHPRVIAHMLERMGLPLREADVVQYANIKKQEAR